MTGGNSFLTGPEAQEQVRLARTRRHGATIVEFSLVFLLFVVVLVALTEFGRAMWTYATIAHAARQGARYGMVHGSANLAAKHGVENAVKRNCIGLDVSRVQVTPTWGKGVDAADVDRGDPIKVQVTYPFEFVAAGLLVKGGGTIKMSSTSQMTVLN